MSEDDPPNTFRGTSTDHVQVHPDACPTCGHFARDEAGRCLSSNVAGAFRAMCRCFCQPGMAVEEDRAKRTLQKLQGHANTDLPVADE